MTSKLAAEKPCFIIRSNNTKDKAVEELFFALVKKLKYDEDYDFTKEVRNSPRRYRFKFKVTMKYSANYEIETLSVWLNC